MSRTAVVLTVGNEIVSGDTENTNASWIARRLARLGVSVRLIAAVRDDVEEIAAFLRAERPRADFLFVTGGLGGTPDDITREAVAAGFGVPCEEIEDLAADLRARFGARGLGDYAARWACVPRGSRPLANPLGGAPGFVVENVYVLPGLPSEMEAMFDSIAAEFQGAPIGAWRRTYRTTEGAIVSVLQEVTSGNPAVVGRELPALRPGRPRGRGRAEVGRRGGACRGDDVGRERARAGDGLRGGGARRHPRVSLFYGCSR